MSACLLAIRASLIAQLVKNRLQCRKGLNSSFITSLVGRRSSEGQWLPRVRNMTVLFVVGFGLSLGFPGRSAGKESTYSAGDASLIPGSGRSPREEIGYVLQYSWASFVAQLVKNLPAMQETWV